MFNQTLEERREWINKERLLLSRCNNKIIEVSYINTPTNIKYIGQQNEIRRIR